MNVTTQTDNMGLIGKGSLSSASSSVISEVHDHGWLKVDEKRKPTKSYQELIFRYLSLQGQMVECHCWLVARGKPSKVIILILSKKKQIIP